MTYQATYSPDDNKLRLYATSRLPSDLYATVKAAGFRWAPKQELFFAVWSPKAEDLLLQLAEEIGDEDKTLTQRAEERAERFEDYSGKRADEADRAKRAVSALADGIPFGQPILVGHHSERRARRDAEKIENGMRKAVRLWETSEYWTGRAAGAIAHAKYKELPQVRARRIKGLEADLRKFNRTIATATKYLKIWQDPEREMTRERAMNIANGDPICWGNWSALDRNEATPEQAQAKAVRVHQAALAHAQRWAKHTTNRLAYEKAMLNEQGASQLLDKKPRPKQLPILNYRAEGGTVTVKNKFHRGQLDVMEQIEMTQAEYAAIYTDHKGTAEVGGTHRVRVCFRQHKRVAVFITDSKVHEKPSADLAEAVGKVAQAFAQENPKEIEATMIDRIAFGQSILRVTTDGCKRIDPRSEEFWVLKKQAEQGVEVVSAPQLFVTPKELAQKVVDLADIQQGHHVLEPSAGTGNLIGAMGGSMFGPRIEGAPVCGSITAIELNNKLCLHLRNNFPLTMVMNADFLAINPDDPLEAKFDRIVMNPPFAGQADIDHVTHAVKFLKEGGKLVAIMSAGVEFRQDRKTKEFRELVEKHGGTIERLPDESFKVSGTNVNTVLVEITK